MLGTKFHIEPIVLTSVPLRANTNIVGRWKPAMETATEDTKHGGVSCERVKAGRGVYQELRTASGVAFSRPSNYRWFY